MEIWLADILYQDTDSYKQNKQVNLSAENENRKFKSRGNKVSYNLTRLSYALPYIT